MLDELLFGEAKEDLPANFIFQHDNATPHAAHLTKKYLEEEEIPILEWPPMSPDLNPIENVWANLQRKVYEGGKTYTNTDDLWCTIQDAFFTITKEEVENLYLSMRNQMIKVLEKQGEKTGY